MTGRYNTYQGKSEKIKEFLSYKNKESSTETDMRKLGVLERYVQSDHKCEVDDMVIDIVKKVQLDDSSAYHYQFLAKYLKHLIKLGNQPNTIKARISTAKAFLVTASHGKIRFDPTLYKHYIKMPKIIKHGNKKGLDRETTIKLIQGCSPYPRLRMIIWFLAATSCRIGETLLLRMSDLHLDGKPEFGRREPFLPYISIRGETTKTKQDRTVLLTSEITDALSLFIDDKYKGRSHTNRNDKGRVVSTDKKYKPDKHPDDYLFLHVDRNYKEDDAARYVYRNLVNELHGILENMGKLDNRFSQRTPNRQYAITFHKLRMGVRTRISDLGFKESKEFGDFYMGHDTSTYYNPTDDEYKRNFLLCQNEITYFDEAQIKKSHGEVTTRIDKVEDTTSKDIVKLNAKIAEMEKQLASTSKLAVFFHNLYKDETGKTNKDIENDLEAGSKFWKKILVSAKARRKQQIKKMITGDANNND